MAEYSQTVWPDPDRYRTAKTAAGFLTDIDRATFIVAGPDAPDFLDALTTNSIAQLEPEAGCYSLLLDAKGRIQTDMRVLRRNEDLLLDLPADGAPALSSAAISHRIGYAVNVVDRTRESGRISVLGPGAAQATGLTSPLRESTHRTVQVSDCDLLAVGTNEGVSGVDLILDRGDIPAVSAHLESLGIDPVDGPTVECLRIESGRARFGVDMGPTTLPQEARVDDRAVSFTKGCYIGQETVARLKWRGHTNRRLVGLALPSYAPPGTTVRHGVREVGRVTSSTVSPIFGPIALAMLRREVEIGASVALDGQEGTAVVKDVPFNARASAA